MGSKKSGGEQELAKLSDLSRAKLGALWQAVYGCPPPPGERRELLVYSAAWRLQSNRLGGFSREVKRMLRREIDRIGRECRNAEDIQSSATISDRSALDTSKVQEKTLLPGDKFDADDEAAIASSSAFSGAWNHDEINDKHGRKEPRERRRLSPGCRLLRDWNGCTHAVDVMEKGFLYDGTLHRSLSAIARQITGAHWSGPRFFGL